MTGYIIPILIIFLVILAIVCVGICIIEFLDRKIRRKKK